MTELEKLKNDIIEFDRILDSICNHDYKNKTGCIYCLKEWKRQ